MSAAELAVTARSTEKGIVFGIYRNGVVAGSLAPVEGSKARFYEIETADGSITGGISMDTTMEQLVEKIETHMMIVGR